MLVKLHWPFISRLHIYPLVTSHSVPASLCRCVSTWCLKKWTLLHEAVSWTLVQSVWRTLCANQELQTTFDRWRYRKKQPSSTSGQKDRKLFTLWYERTVNIFFGCWKWLEKMITPTKVYGHISSVTITSYTPLENTYQEILVSGCRDLDRQEHWWK